MNVWVEVASSKNDHGGPGWDYGTCVWCPSITTKGSLGTYKIILEAVEGDIVVNCLDGRITGWSVVDASCQKTSETPPKVGQFGYTKIFLRLPLRDYKEATVRPTIADVAKSRKAEITKDIETNRPKYYLFSLYPVSSFWPEGRVVLSQGRFFAKTTLTLARILFEEMGEKLVQ